MNNTRDIILRFIKIRQAVLLSERKDMSNDNVQKLRDFILENRRQIPPFALAHFDRLEASGKSGIAEIENGRCCCCGTKISDEELKYLKDAKSIGVCDNCYAFIYNPSEECNVSKFFEDFLKD